ncbi:restriction endonuclease subunit S [Acinetobacter bouvetii]|uniref:EcoKI restriction-modification system protein HsdS n=2 Tax=Acinetobacter TaxID=469 RepID=A0A811GFH3_9GAMM|nr:restriction endonuclease subunit S [Acinetobacter bouvetii]CAB1223335.1 EcoKI restriction-modification system protein HsdS [Acinetobacter bouvetii]
MFPKLRFKEFDGDWLKLKYKDVLTIKYGKDHKSLNDGDIPVLGTGGIMRYVDSYLYDGESILIGRKGTIDKPQYINEKFWTVDTLFYTEIKENIVPLFLFQHALEVNWLGLNEATGVPSLNTTSIYNVDISIPSKEEQTKIVTFLSAVDEKISQIKQKHELLSQYKQGMMQKLFSQQIRFKADDGSEFGEWEETTLEKIGTFLKGKGISKADIVCDGQIPCVRYGELYTHYGEVISKVISATNIDVNNLVLSKANDILIPASGETQIDIATASCILDDGIALSGDLNIFRTKENGIFLSYLIRSKLKMKIAQLAQGNSVVHLYATQLKGVELNLPCLEEQTQIANFLSAIDQKIEVVSKQIEQAKQWKKGLLQQMFI